MATKNAFITGCNVGQANLLAKALVQRGWRVFAGVLPGAPTDLKTGGNLTVVDQDVSNTESVRRSAEIVTEALGGEGLDLLMNVAGVANIAVGVLEGVDLAQAERLFHINTFGQLRVIQAFLPLLRKNAPGSRIANYSSGAIIANPVGAGIYNMTKHAIHGMTLTLRHELAPFGIQVTSIVPGGVLTGMSANAHENTRKSWASQPAEIQKIYEPLRPVMCQVLPDMLEKTGSTPEQALEGTLAILDKKTWAPMEYLGKDVKPMGLMRRIFSDRQLEAIMRRTFKIPAHA
ncbi:NAD(P)-dependent dehydrogenase, short-chain alcohol dehydrogenase family [Fontimonas thermophila]|uniref:NAD(P)-dependent dehydrogenase, short-chain alcohol dehydrogenase family n=1 Tax=Fontimonas thermophila TaxID=1076937 RepID=A0A1I2JE32_9GAMM|nr:SDR family NAD(P)-dependent oxidoreductase [Fontimonas thermophila]SFF51116.1 NAD(P)-dependent dehydrogenase, short-chain alcohol dehydrogenase family [Fontimonas thermophila]